MVTLVSWLIPNHGRTTRSLIGLVGGCFILGGLYGLVCPLAKIVDSGLLHLDD